MRVGSWWIGVPGAIAATALTGCGESRETSRSEAARPSSPTVVTTAQADHAQQEASRAPLPFRVPRGYVAERVAAGPLVMHPMFAAFDDRGRLFVAGSSGHGGNGVELARTLPDDIRCLEDTDGDGRFDRATVFADRLTFPQGVLCHDGAVYTASAPSL